MLAGSAFGSDDLEQTYLVLGWERFWRDRLRIKINAKRHQTVALASFYVCRDFSALIFLFAHITPDPAIWYVWVCFALL